MKLQRHILAGLALMLLVTVPSAAQTIVSGWVRDEIGEPLIGAVVMIRDTQIGAITDEDGMYELEIPAQYTAPVLKASYLGFDDVLKKPGRSRRVNFVMAQAATSIDQAVVVGFGTQDKASITGAISSIDGDELSDMAGEDATNLLMGRFAGLMSLSEGGLPGEGESEIHIRGQESENDSSPLILVDGVERSLSQIPVEDIKSISILKDASATAVYGMRGANGVILVTTRRGQSGKARINFSHSHSITSYTRMPEVLGAAQTARLIREGATNHGIDPSGRTETTWYYGVSEYDNHLYESQSSPFTHPDNDFVDIFTKNGSRNYFALSVSGGAPTLRYYVSLTESDMYGMFETDIDKIKEKDPIRRLRQLSSEIDDCIKPSGYDSQYWYKGLSFRSNLDIHLTRDLEVKVNLSFFSGNQNRPAASDAAGNFEGSGIFKMAYNNSPQRFAIFNADGSIGGGLNAWRQNPVVGLCYSGFSRYSSNRLNDNIQFTYNLSDLLYGLSLTGNFSYDASWSTTRSVNERPEVYAFNPDEGTYERGLSASLPSNSSSTSPVGFNGYAELAVRYSHSFQSKHNLSAVVLGNYTTRNSGWGGTYAYVPQVYKSLITRVNYNYLNKYLFEFNAGYNGSNRFAEGHRYQLFPAASVGWVFTQEEFMEPLKKVMNFGKIRASYGTVGSDNAGSFSFYYLDSYSSGEAYSFGETWHSRTAGLKEGVKANPLLGWEISRKFNLGLNTKWFSSALEFNFDAFYNHRSNILSKDYNYTGTSGIPGVPYSNIGVNGNHGFEVELNFTRTTENHFTWYTYANCSYSRSTILKNGEVDKPYPYMYNRGHSLGQVSGYHYVGLFESYDEIAASPTQFGLTNLMPGDMKYADLNGDGVVDENDVATIGFSRMPRMSVGLTLGCRWNHFDAKVMFQGGFISSVSMTGDIAWDNSSGNYFPQHLDRWTPETARTATYPRLNYRALEQNQNYVMSDFWLKDGSYLRMKNIQFGYSVPRELTQKAGISSLRIYVTGSNLLTFDYLKVTDPESRYPASGVYPQQKLFTAGLSLSF